MASIDTRCLARLERAAALETAGDLTGANAEYNAALALEPRLAYADRALELPPPFPEFAWRRHHAMREWYRRAFLAAIESAEADSGTGLERLRRSAEMFCGQRPLVRAHPLQRPHDLLVADLPPVPWRTRADFPWAPALERATAGIREEYLAVEGRAGFRPYIVKAPDASWRALENDPTWNSFFLFERARRNEANCARCPTTLAALEPVPLARAAGVPTEVFFSVLAPGGHIPPHFGLCNAKVVVHLPLVVPAGCLMTVADESRPWREGELLAFDDSFRHEARNPGDRHRVVLILEVWNPDLSSAEVLGVGRMLEAVQRFKSLSAG